MHIRTRITRMAHERGMTAGEVARALGLYRSNVSAMDRGRRAVSLKTLGRIAHFLGCGPSDLLEANLESEKPVYPGKKISRRLAERDLGMTDGTERQWVHRALLAWQRHQRSFRRRP